MRRKWVLILQGIGGIDSFPSILVAGSSRGNSLVCAGLRLPFRIPVDRLLDGETIAIKADWQPPFPLIAQWSSVFPQNPDAEQQGP